MSKSSKSIGSFAAFGRPARTWILTALLGAIACLSGTGASAEERLVKFIEHYNRVEIRLQGKAADCGLDNIADLQARVGNGLTTIGITPNPDAITTAYLFVWGEPFGILDSQCAVFVSLRLGADMPGAAIKFESKIEPDSMLVEKLTLVEGTFPGAFYMTTNLYVKLSGEAKEHLDEVIDRFIQEIAAHRAS